MKQYLKMSGYFIGSVTINADGQICDDKHFRGSTDIAEDYYGPICHAINSHDELVKMNQELLAALEAVVEWYDMEADHSIEPDFYKRMAACQVSEDMAREAIAKAKVGAA